MAFSVRVAVFAAVAFTLSTTAVIAFRSAAFFAHTAFEAPAWADVASLVSPVAAARAGGARRSHRPQRDIGKRMPPDNVEQPAQPQRHNLI